MPLPQNQRIVTAPPLRPDQRIPLPEPTGPMGMPEPLAGSLAYQLGELTNRFRDANDMLMERNTLIETGRSQLSEDIRDFLQNSERSRVARRFEEHLAAGRVTADNFAEFVQAYEQGQAEAQDSATIERAFFEDLLSRQTPDEPTYTRQVRSSWRRHWYRSARDAFNIQRDVESYLANSNASTGRSIVDFMQLLVPFLEQYRLRGIQEDLGLNEPGFVNAALDYVWPSRMLDRVRGRFMELDGESRRNFARAIMDAVSANSTVLGYQNDFLRFDMTTRLIDDSYGEGFDWDGLFTNVAGVADAVYGARLLRAGFMGLSSLRGTPYDRAAQANPDAARNMGNAALEEPTGQQLSALTGGQNPGQVVINFVYPKPDGVILRGGPADLGDYQVQLQQKVRGILSTAEENGYNFTAAEKAASPARVLQSLDEARGVHAHANKHTVRMMDADGFELDITWGRNRDVGFSSFGEAMNRAQAILTPTELKNIKILRRDPESGDLVPLSRRERTRLQKLHDTLARASRERGQTTVARLQELLDDARVNDIEQVPALEARIAQVRQADEEVNIATAALEDAYSAAPGTEEALLNVRRARERALVEAPDQVPAMDARIEQLEKLVNQEYYFSAPYRHNFNALDKFAFSPTDIGTGGILGQIFPSGGAFMRYLQDPSARFSPQISGSALRSGDKAIGIEAAMHELMGDFKKLGRRSQETILRLFDLAGQQNRRLSYSWIRSEQPDLSPAEWRGVIALKSVTDTMYLLHNRRLTLQMEEGGFRRLTVLADNGEEFTHAVAPISESAARKVTSVFDPHTGGSVVIDDQFIRDLYARGGSIGKSWSPIDRGRFQYNFVVQDPARGASLGPLPNKVLNYREGYIPRMWKGAYFITLSRGEIIVDGARSSDTGRAVAVTNSRKEAQRYIDELNAEQQQLAEEAAARGEAFVPNTYDFRIGKEMLEKDAFRADMDIMELQGRMFYSRRGPELQILSKNQDSHLVGPIESLGRGIAATSQRVGMETTIEGFKKSFLETFGDLLPTRGVMPPDISAIKSNKGIADGRVAQAQNMYQYIRFLEGLEPDAVNQAWKNTMLSLADYASGKGWDRTADFFLNRQRDPFSALRATGFYLFLGANPMRQYLLQSQQVLMLSAWNPRYMASGQMLFDKALLDGAFMALMRSNATGDYKTYQNFLVAASKTSRYTPQEIDEMVSAFRQSGLPAAVDHNMLVHDSVYSGFRDAAPTWAGRATQTTANLAAYPFKIGKLIGFDRGEFNNLAYTWLTVRNRYMRENPGININSSEARNAIATQARQLALGMTRQGSFGYQRGWLSLATQFLSIQHKALMAMLPQMVGGNKALNAADKARIATANMVIWGASGFGLREVIMQVANHLGVEFTDDQLIEGDGWRFPEHVQDFLYGGLLELTLNKIAEAVTDDDVNVAYSQEFAPASGIIDTPAQFLRGIVAGEKSMIELLFGPTGSLVSGRTPTNGPIGGRFGRAIDQIRMIAGMRGDESITADDVEAMLEAAGTVVPSYNNYLRMRYALETGRLIDARGRPSAHVTRTEAIIRGLFGVRSESEIEWNELILPLEERVSRVQDIANTYYDRLMEITARAQPGDDMHHIQEAMRAESWVMQALSFDDWEQEIAREVLLRRMTTAAQAGQEDLALRLMRLVSNGGVPADVYTRTAIINSQLPEDQKRLLIELIDYSTADSTMMQEDN